MEVTFYDSSSMQSEILEKSLVREMSEGGGRRGSVSTADHSRTHPTSASAMEQLQSLLKQKEGELANVQVYIQVMLCLWSSINSS